ncbi:MAG TPA: NAD-dependent epimerase/dehydratase family protein [Candidatus Nitrosotalea sp.]|nr:NAD-dependent epimerase/dehydratase family protein [Candidatus Nitrosotalea sp.]
MRVVVSGGAGFIGSHLTNALLDRGDTTLVLDDLSTGSAANLDPRAEFERHDIRSAEAQRAVLSWRPDAVCHLAAQMSVSRSVREPEFDASVNILGGLNLLEAARRSNSRFLFSSTGGALYGEASILPTPESYPAWPRSPYGVSKLSFEHYLSCYRAEHQLSYVALRYANVYGPRQNPHGEAGVVAIFCRSILSGLPPTINGSGDNTRDYVHVHDVVAANLLALDSDEVGHFNVGTGRQTSVNAVARRLLAALGSDLDPVHGPARPGEQTTSALECRLIQEQLGWAPKIGLEAGLDQTAEWFRAPDSPSAP